MRVSAEVDERTLREIYLPAFEHIVTDGRAVDGDVRLQQDQRHVRVRAPLAAHRAAARRVGLRRAGHVRLGRGARPGRRAGRRAGPGDAARPRRTATRRWSRRCRRAGWTRSVLDLAAAPGAAAGATGPPRRTPAEVDVDAHHALARRAAAECIVLLRNDGGVLPLAGSRHGRGARRARPHPALPGRRQLPGEPDPGRRRAGRADRGAARARRCGSPPATRWTTRRRRRRGAGRRGRRGRPRAPTWSSPASGCRPSPSPRATTARTWTCRRPSSRCSTRWPTARPGCRWSSCCSTARPCAPAAGTTAPRRCVECWLGGQAGGSAVADVLTGAVNPSGKLAETIPLRLADCSAYAELPRRGRASCATARACSSATAATTRRERAVAYPFGHGLSYTSFGYDELSVSRTGSVDGGDLAVTVSCRVRNTGDRAGRGDRAALRG